MSRQEERLSAQREEIVRLQAEAVQVDSIEQECDVLTQELSLYGERYSIYEIRYWYPYLFRVDGSGTRSDLYLGGFIVPSQCCGSVTFWYGSGSADLYH